MNGFANGSIFNFSKRVFLLIVVFSLSRGIFSQSEQKQLPSTFERDVPYTKEQNDFIDAHLGHKIETVQQRKKLYAEAESAAQKTQDQYSRLVQLARAEYYYGLSITEITDLATVENMSLSDSDSEESLNELVGKIYDKGIEYAQAALKIKKGSDAYTVLSQLISANCTAKGVSYVLGNGLKVRSNAKKAIEADYSNGTAHFLTTAQDIYAPGILSKLTSGRKKMLEILNDEFIRLENQDKLSVYTAIGYTYFKQKDWDKATEWYNKALELYPGNYSSTQIIKKINEARKK